MLRGTALHESPRLQEGRESTRLLLRVMFSSSLCMFSRSVVSDFCVFKASSHLASLCSSWIRAEQKRRGEAATLLVFALQLSPCLAPDRHPSHSQVAFKSS